MHTDQRRVVPRETTGASQIVQVGGMARAKAPGPVAVNRSWDVDGSDALGPTCHAGVGPRTEDILQQALRARKQKSGCDKGNSKQHAEK